MQQLLKVPPSLFKMQRWFGQVITRPLIAQQHSQPYTTEGVPLVEDAAHWICPSHTMQPHERIEAYNQQYWWRLLEILRLDYPFLTRLFGVADFNRLLAVPYLVAYPPRHWFLKVVTEQLPQFLEENYFEEDRQLVLEAALLDLKVHATFLGSALPVPEARQCDEEELAAWLESPWVMQPYLQLVSTLGPLMELREQFLEEEPDYWLEHDFPSFKRDHRRYLLLFCDPEYDISWRELTQTQYTLLEALIGGKSLAEGCALLQVTPEMAAEAEANLQLWLQSWLAQGWMVQPHVKIEQMGH